MEQVEAGGKRRVGKMREVWVAEEDLGDEGFR